MTSRRGHALSGMLGTMAIEIDSSLVSVDWGKVKADLAADHFDNGRSADALRLAFERSQHVALARDQQTVVGMARLLSDGVSNSYLLDVWTASSHRRRGIASKQRSPTRSARPC